MKKTLLLLSFIIIAFASPTTINAKTNRIKRTFTITGYYSPLPNQNFYITGDYDSEIRLNGKGIAGADGTGVYPGMIAAPYTYEFGTNVCIPNLGCGKVHDRGGAIVKKGDTTLAKHDRLDVWMGYGEEGLLRALSWGVEHLECEMFSKESNVDIYMNFEVPPQLGDIIDIPNRPIFNKNLYIGSTGEKVKSIQTALNKLGFYEGFIDGKFNENVKNAVFNFQKKYFILEKETDLGAGSFGPKTRSKLTTILYKENVQEKITEAWNDFSFNEKLSKGERSHEVFKLQQILVQKEFMTVNPTGYFGPVTKKALIDLQISYNLIKNKNSNGAGTVGPKTKELLNNIIEQERAIINLEIKEQLAYKENRNKMLAIAGKPLEFKSTVAKQ